jgi:Uma2 family endonuclease
MTETKPAGKWTYEDLFTLPEDGKRYEIIEGTLFELPPVGSVHALTVTKLIAMLIPIMKSKGGHWLTAPLDVFLWGADPVQPDILAILPNGAAKPVKRGIEGPPDLIIEVVTPINRDHDVLTKRALYGRAGVREYWIVDPAERTFEILTLDRDALHSTIVASGSDVLVSPLLGPLPNVADDMFAGVDA